MLTFFVILILEWDIDEARHSRTEVFDQTQYIFDDKNACESYLFNLLKTELDNFKVTVTEDEDAIFSDIQGDTKYTILCKEIVYDPANKR